MLAGGAEELHGRAQPHEAVRPHSVQVRWLHLAFASGKTPCSLRAFSLCSPRGVPAMSRGSSARLRGGTLAESLLCHACMRRQDLGNREMERMFENKQKGCFTTSCVTETSPCLIPSTQKCLKGMSSYAPINFTS